MKSNAQHESPSPRALESAAGLALRPRRGSVIILAVGVLAALAIIAVAYTVAVRTDRQSAATHQVVSTVTGQEKAVVAELGAILTADLWGNEVVTPDMPRWIDNSGNEAAPGSSGAVRLWPAMFQDGEFSDFPWVDGDPATNTFNHALVGQAHSTNIGVELDPFALNRVAPRQDDAWLASSEPVSSNANPNTPWDTWPQISNIRSAYRFQPNGNQSRWVRDDGRFADLGRFFLDDTGAALARPDPEADLTNFRDTHVTTNAAQQVSGPALGRNQRVFAYQINAMGNNDDERYTLGPNTAPPTYSEPFPYEPIDERYWVDTDGDLRPDARWQTLDALGNLGGLRWVVAVRIIDSSGQINVNTSIDSGLNATGQYGAMAPAGISPQTMTTVTNAETMGVGAARPALGATPAETDLFRLMHMARFTQDLSTFGAWGSNTSPSRNLVQLDRYDLTSPARPAFEYHLDRGVRLTDLLREDILAVTPTATTAYANAGDWRYTFTDRARLYREFGFAPFERSSFAKAYPLADEIDLKTYWAVNNDKVLSELERSFDETYLPGELSTMDAARDVVAVGPLRSADPTRVERSFQLLNPGAVPRPTPEEIRDDTRHLLTTYSGVADFGPVPVLNTASEGSPARLAFGDRFINTKIRLHDFPTNTQGSSSEEQQLKEGKKYDLIRRSFEAFTWALAPLATDLPLMPPLLAGDVGATGALTSDKHYGGGTNGPATSLQSVSGPMGTSYAVLRAGSLAVNIADATDNERPAAAATDPTAERPTVARLYNVAQLSPTQAPASVPDVGGVLELGTRFSHGDIPQNPTLMPAPYVGQPANGVTLIGLDRQPFLRGASILAVYQPPAGTQGRKADPAAGPPIAQVPLVVHTNSAGEQVGSIFAVELANPWPTKLDAAGYIVAMATDVGWYEFEINSIVNGNTEIPAGQTVAFYVSLTTTGGQSSWDPVETEWASQAIAAGANIPRKVGTTPRRRDLTNGAEITGALDPVPFHGFAAGGGRPTVLMLFTSSASVPVLLLDRMATPGAGEFPLTHVGDVQIPEPATIQPGQFWEGRLASAGSIRRKNDTPTPENAGFPAYIVERSAENLPDSYTAPRPGGWYSTWESSFTPVAIEDLLGGGFAVGYTGDPKAHIGDVDPAPAFMPSVQFFVPDEPLISPSELGMLCAFTHMYVHNTPGALSLADTVRAADPTLVGEEDMRTIGEQLGLNAHAGYDAVQAPGANNRNPYLGVLDPSRFTLARVATPGALGPVNNLPDALAVPLASRIYDCFEALDIPPGLAQGRINVNTAPTKVLRMLPWMAPWCDIDTTGGVYAGKIGNATAGLIANGQDRGALLASYRDARQDVNNPFRNPADRSTVTNLAGLRSVGVAAANIPEPGIVAMGELALLARWNDADPTSPGASVGPIANPPYSLTFAEVGQMNAGMRENSGVPTAPALVNELINTDGILDVRPNTGSSVGPKPYDPIDDAEERLAVFRPLANTASTRSDVFTAWFVIRGYDPRRIAAVEIPANGSDDEKVREAMNQLTPTHESRWLAVFDRSNVKLPTDRPRLVLLSELPVR